MAAKSTAKPENVVNRALSGLEKANDIRFTEPMATKPGILSRMWNAVRHPIQTAKADALETAERATRRVSTSGMLPNAQKYAQQAVIAAQEAGVKGKALDTVAKKALTGMMDAEMAARGNFGASMRNLGRSLTGQIPNEVAKIAKSPVHANRAGLLSRSASWLPNTMAKYRKTSLVGLGAAAVYGVSRLVGGRRADAAQAQYQGQMQEMAAMQQQTAALEQQAALMEQQARIAQDNAVASQYGGVRSYKNSVSAEEAAYMNSQMRDSGAQGFAQAEQNRRNASQQAPSNLGE